MDRFQFIEEEQKPVDKCICKETLYEGDKVYQIDDYLVCDDADCFKKLCIKKFGAIYGRLDKLGNVR